MNHPVRGGGNQPPPGTPMSFAQQSQHLHAQSQQQQQQGQLPPAQPQMRQQQTGGPFVTHQVQQQQRQIQRLAMPVGQQNIPHSLPQQTMISPQNQQQMNQQGMVPMTPQQSRTPPQQQLMPPQHQLQPNQMTPQRGHGMLTPQQSAQQHQMTTAAQQQQQHMAGQVHGTPSSSAPGELQPNDAGSTPSIKAKIKGFFHQENQGPNLGFKPTAAMAQRHEDSLVSGKRPLFQFQVTKLRSWRTGYVRLLCLYDDHFATFDPDTHQVTNTWNYTSLTDFVAAEKDQLLLQVDSDKLKFQCHNVDRSMVLSSLLQCQDEHTPMTAPMILCNRWTRQGTQVPSALRVTPHALVEVHPNTKKRIQTYNYVNILAIAFTSDDPTGLILHFKNKKTTRLISITTKSRSDVVTFMRQNFDRIGLELRMTDSSTVAQWKETRLQQQQTRSHTIATEWNVTKQSRRHDAAVVGSSNGWAGGLVQRTLCITGDGLILEKDTAGMIVAARPLSEIYALVRPYSVGDQIRIEYDNGDSRTYASPSRDSLLVSLLDAAITLGKNPKVQVSEVPSGGYCLASFAKSAATEKSGGLFQPISIPTHCLKRVHAVATAAFAYMNSNSESSTEEGVPMNPAEECRNVMEICREFNASVLPTAEGLPTTEKDKHVLGSIGALWGLVAELLEVKKDRHLAEQTAGPLFQTLHRLSKTKAGYKNSIELATFVDCLPLLWTIEDAFCKFWAFRALTVLLSGLPTRDMEPEYINKSVIFKAGGMKLVHGLVLSLVNLEKSDLIRMVMSDILQSLLCTYADTTSPEDFAAFIRFLGENYRALLGTLYQQTPYVIENAALLLHLLSTHAPNVAAALREAALSSAILLHHFHSAIFSPLEGQRFLSRFLCSLWLTGPIECAEKKLLKRMIPSGFMGYLKMPLLSRAEEEQLDELERDGVENNVPESNEPNSLAVGLSNASGAAGTNTSRLRSRIALARGANKDANRPTPENFRIFFHVLTQNHSLPDLIWNQQTRRELRIGLESEIQYIQRETEARGMGNIAWNHQQFGISYPSLENELKVGNVYMRVWLQAGDGFIKTWEEPLRLFEVLFRRFLCEMDRDAKVTIMCIRCLERLYSIHGQNIGPFPDVMILIRSMTATRSIETQHRLLGLLATILGVQEKDDGGESAVNIPENAEQLLNIESIEQLCQFVAWGHTNGLQVGNLMTNMLGKLNTGFAMLTDGTQQGPEPFVRSTQGEEKAPAEDVACPPVWFIATTGRIPPPAELVRGPFRVSELQRMMDIGDLSPFTLVTPTHAESYEDEGGSGEVGEAQIDTGKWKRLDEVWQLRWQLCTDGSGGGIFSPSDVSLRAVRSLTRLVDLHNSLDSQGAPYAPIPIAKRIICGLNRDSFHSERAESPDKKKSFLSILSQAILCNDPEVVDYTAELLSKLTKYNEEATSKFYLTGVYFFIASYTGSNFKNLARLLHSTHLNQHFRSGFAATASKSELPLKERSILGTMLPEGVLYILFNYGVERFAEVFVGNYDTPEVIWSVEMRKHLIEMVTQHLGDFPRRLWQNTTTEYEYCPMPSLAYKRLEREIFCHNYYLHNLCDEKRFPDWPISEPVEVFRACLEELKKQMSRDEEDEEQALQRALKVLVLNPGDGSKELRKAYRSLARKFHPDKNPAGRETFESIQESYELLLPILASGQNVGDLSAHSDSLEHVGEEQQFAHSSAEGFVGGLSQMQTMQLLFRTQSLICRRFESEMGKYKYPAYQIVLSCLKLPKSCEEAVSKGDVVAMHACCIMTPKRAQFILDAVRLVFQTCLVSPLNAEELVAECGVSILEDLLDFFIKIARSTGAPEKARVATDSTICEILSTLLHTIAGVAFYETGRDAVKALPDLSRFCVNWRRCLDGKRIEARFKAVGDSQIKKFALEGVVNMARDGDLQGMLIGAGIIWPLTRFLLGFDPTLDELNVSIDTLEDDLGVSQAACNAQARLATRALGMLCGWLQHPSLTSPENPELQKAMNNILTSPIAMLLRNKRSTGLLSSLNSNIQTPSRIWSVSMRNELLKLLDTMEKSRQEESVRSASDELEGVAAFEYAELKDELQLGGVYIRIFNQLGVEKGAMRHVHNQALFVRQLTDFLARCINSSKGLPEGWSAITMKESDDTQSANPGLGPRSGSISDNLFVEVITAFRNLVRVDGIVDDVLSDASLNVSPVLLSLLELPQDSEAFEIGFDILSGLGSKQEFADAVASQGALWRLLWILERADERELIGEKETYQTNVQGDILRKQRGWILLESLSSAPSVASKIVDSTAWLELLGILVGYGKFTKVWIARIGAAKTLSRLLWDPKTGPMLAPLLHRFLPETLVVVLKEEGPDTMLKLFDSESDTPELIWDGSMRAELRRVVAMHLNACIEKRRTDAVDDKFSLEDHDRVEYKKLLDELFVGGVYVSRFLKEPTFNLRDPTAFLEMLLKRWDHEMKLQAQPGETTTDVPPDPNSEVGALQTLTSASVYLCRVKANLCDKLSQWGYMSRCLVFLEHVLARQLLEAPLLSVMRILHVAVNRRPNVEALIVSGKNDRTHGIVAFTIQAIGKDSLHSDAAFMVDMLKKVFTDALEETNRASATIPTRASMTSHSHEQPGKANVAQILVMAPSPAPGEGPVSRNRVTIGNPLDDPLAMAPARNQGSSVAQQAPRTSVSTQRTGDMHGSTPLYAAMQAQHNFYSENAPISVPYQPSDQAQLMGDYSTNQMSTAGYSPGVPSSFPAQNLGTRGFQSNSLHIHTGGQGAQQRYQQQHPHSQLAGNDGLGGQQQFQRQQPHSQFASSGQGTQPHYHQQQHHASIFQLQSPHQTGQGYTPGPGQPYSGQVRTHQVNVGGHSSTYPPQPATTQPTFSAKASPGQHHVVNQPSPPGRWEGPGTSRAPVFYQDTHGRGDASDTSSQQGALDTPLRTPATATAPSLQTPTISKSPLQPGMLQFPISQAQDQQMYDGGDDFSAAPRAPVNTPSHLYRQHPGLGGAEHGGGSAVTTQVPPSHVGTLNGNVGTPTNYQVLQGGVPKVETIGDSVSAHPTSHHLTEGTGVDARSQTDPNAEAGRLATTANGAPGCADGRVALLQSALLCELPRFLIEDVLENSGLSKVKDPAAVKVHAVELLKLLTTDPGFGMKFSLCLDSIAAWKKYRTQDHSLFITGPEQKADYFLTDGGRGETRMLTDK